MCKNALPVKALICKKIIDFRVLAFFLHIKALLPVRITVIYILHVRAFIDKGLQIKDFYT